MAKAYGISIAAAAMLFLQMQAHGQTMAGGGAVSPQPPPMKRLSKEENDAWNRSIKGMRWAETPAESYHVNPEAWDAWYESRPESKNIQDQRYEYGPWGGPAASRPPVEEHGIYTALGGSDVGRFASEELQDEKEGRER